MAKTSLYTFLATTILSTFSYHLDVWGSSLGDFEKETTEEERKSAGSSSKPIVLQDIGFEEMMTDITPRVDSFIDHIFDPTVINFSQLSDDFVTIATKLRGIANITSYDEASFFRTYNKFFLAMMHFFESKENYKLAEPSNVDNLKKFDDMIFNTLFWLLDDEIFNQQPSRKKDESIYTIFTWIHSSENALSFIRSHQILRNHLSFMASALKQRLSSQHHVPADILSILSTMISLHETDQKNDADNKQDSLDDRLHSSALLDKLQSTYIENTSNYIINYLENVSSSDDLLKTSEKDLFERYVHNLCTAFSHKKWPTASLQTKENLFYGFINSIVHPPAGKDYTWGKPSDGLTRLLLQLFSKETIETIFGQENPRALAMSLLMMLQNDAFESFIAANRSLSVPILKQFDNCIEKYKRLSQSPQDPISQFRRNNFLLENEYTQLKTLYDKLVQASHDMGPNYALSNPSGLTHQDETERKNGRDLETLKHLSEDIFNPLNLLPSMGAPLPFPLQPDLDNMIKANRFIGDLRTFSNYLKMESMDSYQSFNIFLEILKKIEQNHNYVRLNPPVFDALLYVLLDEKVWKRFVADTVPHDLAQRRIQKLHSMLQAIFFTQIDAVFSPQPEQAHLKVVLLMNCLEKVNQYNKSAKPDTIQTLRDERKKIAPWYDAKKPETLETRLQKNPLIRSFKSGNLITYNHFTELYYQKYPLQSPETKTNGSPTQEPDGQMKKKGKKKAGITAPQQGEPVETEEQRLRREAFERELEREAKERADAKAAAAKAKKERAAAKAAAAPANTQKGKASAKGAAAAESKDKAAAHPKGRVSNPQGESAQSHAALMVDGNLGTNEGWSVVQGAGKSKAGKGSPQLAAAPKPASQSPVLAALQSAPPKPAVGPKSAAPKAAAHDVVRAKPSGLPASAPQPAAAPKPGAHGQPAPVNSPPAYMPPLEPIALPAGQPPSYLFVLLDGNYSDKRARMIKYIEGKIGKNLRDDQFDFLVDLLKENSSSQEKENILNLKIKFWSH